MDAEIDVSIKPFTARWLQQQIKRYLACETSVNLKESVRQVTIRHRTVKHGRRVFAGVHCDFAGDVSDAIDDFEYLQSSLPAFMLRIAALAYQELPNDD